MLYKEKLSPIIKQYLNIKKKYKNILLFYQIGEFYELFYDDAIKISSLLNLNLTEKKFVKHKNVPMAGIPIFSYKKYVLKLIKLGESIAICNQINNNIINNSNKIKNRRVVKIITPGTISESYYLNKKKDNYISCVFKGKDNNFGFSLIDIFSGKFYVLQIKSLNELKTELFKNNPSEIIYCKDNFNFTYLLNEFNFFNSISLKYFNYNFCLNVLLDHFKLSNLDCFGISDKKLIIISAGCLLNYIKFTQFINLLHINKIKLISDYKYLFMDFSTIKNLELIDSLSNSKNTLLNILDSTVTPMGGRLLKRWLIRPILDLNIINNRHSIISFIWFYNDDLRKILNKIGDLERILGRIILFNVSSKDLINFKIYLILIFDILKLFKDSKYLNFRIFKYLFLKKNLLKKIIILIEKSIVDPKLDSNNLILKGYNKKLDKLKYFNDNKEIYIKSIEESEKKKTKINNLFIKYNKIHGYYIQVNKLDWKLVPNYYIKYKSFKYYKRYIFSDLKKLEFKIIYINKKIKLLENKIFNKILNYIILYINDLKIITNCISKLDVLSSFVERSICFNFKKPKLFNNCSFLDIRDSRHPVLDSSSEFEFITNNILINKKIRTLLITGPNMGGKSTYMRQIAIICIMSYIGCYVPASKAHIGFIDKILTRIGFSDDISSNKSTFMIEMSEVSYIINNATKNSLLLIDEMGRGTSFYEGISLAWSCLDYISRNIKSITLFSTHFFELFKIGKLYYNISNVFFDFIKKDNDIIFLYKIKNGVCNTSCSFLIANKCGIPKSIIKNSYNIFKRLNFLK